MASAFIFQKGSPSFLGALAVVVIASGAVLAQATKSAKDGSKEAAQPRIQVKQTENGSPAISVKAENILLKEVAAKLSRKLAIPVLVGASLQDRRVTINFSDLLLEPAMQLLANRVYVDYEIDSGSTGDAKAVGIYLNGEGDLEPPINAVVPNNSVALMFEGNTEDVADDNVDSDPRAKDDNLKTEPLRVSYRANYLTVKASKQPLIVVLSRISNEIGVPLEIKEDTTEVIDLNLNKLSVEEVIRRLPPQVRLYVRADLQSLERRPFRLVLAPAAKQS